MKEITMITVKSSQLDAAGYDEEKNELYVEFSSGKVYKYFEVPKKVFDKLIGPAYTKSAGSYFHTDIRMKYRYEKFEPDNGENQDKPSDINLVHPQ